MVSKTGGPQYRAPTYHNPVYVCSNKGPQKNGSYSTAPAWHAMWRGVQLSQPGRPSSSCMDFADVRFREYALRVDGLGIWLALGYILPCLSGGCLKLCVFVGSPLLWKSPYKSYRGISYDFVPVRAAGNIIIGVASSAIPEPNFN